MDTVVFQSYRREDVPPWIGRCLSSVQAWAQRQGYHYRFIDDRIFDRLPDWYRDKAQGQIPVLVDLGRLMVARELLERGHERAVWVDADVVVFDPDRLRVRLERQYAFSWEIWVTRSQESGALEHHFNVNNAFCVFCRGNDLLDFYIHACQAILNGLPTKARPAKAVVGTQFLSDLYNHLRFPVLQDVTLASPLVVQDLMAGGGAALELHRSLLKAPPSGVNLCASLLSEEAGFAETAIEALVRELVKSRGALLQPATEAPASPPAKTSTAMPPA